MTTIYFDTNILISESFFCSAWAQSFIKACALLQINVVVPEIVVDEVNGNYPKHLNDKVRAFQKAERELSKLVDLKSQDFPIADLAEKQASFLEELFDDNGVEIAPYPEIPAKQLVEKSYEKQKPFKDSGEGHKDYILWETIKSHILRQETDSPHIFLTNNVKDFCQTDDKGKFKLHPDLAAQIETKNLRPDIHVSMKSVLEGILMPLMEGMNLDDIPDLGEQDIVTMTNSILLDDLPQRTAYGFEDVPFSDELSINSVDEAQIENVTLAKADDQIAIEITGTVEIGVTGFMEKFVVYSSEEDADFHVVDANWNDHVMLVAATIETPFELSVFYSLASKEVIGHEITLPHETQDPWPYK
jgi:hypothetical protein